MAFSRAAQGMNFQNLTSCLSAVAKLQQKRPETEALMPPLLELAASRVRTGDKMNPAQVSAAIWAAGELFLEGGEVAALTSAVLSKLTLEDIQAFSSMELANLAWGLAQLGERDAVLLCWISQTLAEIAAKMNLKAATLDVPMIVCALTRLQAQEDRMLEAVASRLLQPRTLRKMNDWGLCALAWSWPDHDIKGKVKSVRETLQAQVVKRKLTSSQIERSWLGPTEWTAGA